MVSLRALRGHSMSSVPTELWLEPAHRRSRASRRCREGWDEGTVRVGGIGGGGGVGPLLPSIPHDLTGPGEYIRRRQCDH